MTLAGSLPRTLLAVAACLILCACQGTDWSNVRVASPYGRPTKAVNVSVTMDAEAEDREEVVGAFTEALVDELKEFGFEPNVDVESPDADQLQLSITEWEPGSQALRYFVGFGAGEERVVIIVDVSKPGGKAVFHGRIRSFLAMGFFGGSAKTSLRAAARSIAEAVRSGQGD